MDVAAARPDTACPGLTEGRTPPDRAAERAAERTAGGWFKSSFSQGNGECVECAPLGGGTVGLRDSKRPEGVVLAFGAGEWRAFVTAMREAAIGD